MPSQPLRIHNTKNSGQPPFQRGKTEAQTGAATCPGAGSTSDTASPSPSYPPGSGWKNTWLSSTCMPHTACKPILGGPQPGAGGVRRGGGAPKKWGEADAFPPRCCSRLLPLPRAWTSASLPNHLLFFSHLEPLSGDPLPQALCPGPAAQLFPGWWFGPGWPVPTTLTPAQCPPYFCRPLASIRNYLPPAPQFKGLGGPDNPALPGPAGPLSPILEYPPLLLRAGWVDCPWKLS